jgi:BASS family bile acid:Na+ symporter
MFEIAVVITQIAILIFVVTSMLAMGLSLTIPQIMQPLKNVRFVILALVASFVVVPLFSYLILQVIPLQQGYAIGLILMATAAGPPFLPKLALAAKGDAVYRLACNAIET